MTDARPIVGNTQIKTGVKQQIAEMIVPAIPMGKSLFFMSRRPYPVWTGAHYANPSTNGDLNFVKEKAMHG